jgi:hypothetical protein
VKVVILTTTRIGRTKGAEDAVRRWSDAGDDVVLVTMYPHDPDVWPLAAVVALGAPTTGNRLGKPGRLLVRVFPGAPSRQLAHKVKRSSAARAALDAADFVVAADAPAAATAWWSSRKHPDVPHISGLASALQLSKR